MKKSKHILHLEKRVDLLRALGVSYSVIGKIHGFSAYKACCIFKRPYRVHEDPFTLDKAETPEEYFGEFSRDEEIEWWVWQIGGTKAYAKKYGWLATDRHLPAHMKHLTCAQLENVNSIEFVRSR